MFVECDSSGAVSTLLTPDLLYYYGPELGYMDWKTYSAVVVITASEFTIVETVTDGGGSVTQLLGSLGGAFGILYVNTAGTG